MLFCVYFTKQRTSSVLFVYFDFLSMSDISGSDFSGLSDSSLSNDDFDDLFFHRARPKNEKYVDEVIPKYQETEFLEHFRISRHVAESLAEQFANSKYYKRHFGHYGKLTVLQQTYVYLWFVGHQTASFRDVADRFNITISSLFRIIRRMTYFISELSQQIITWPTPEEKYEIEKHFRENGFAGVIGVIDGTHIKIDKPPNDSESYINRKGYYSIQVGHYF